ncbi:MAG: hypothetical protein R3C03_07310 [Pirellulaceae bacterium]
MLCRSVFLGSLLMSVLANLLPSTALGQKESVTQYIPDDSTMVVVVRPNELTRHQYGEWMPVEVITAAGKQYLGFDPMTLDSGLLFCSRTYPGASAGNWWRVSI